MKGIDISMHNNTVDFKKIKNDGIEIVIIKATEGVNYVDPLLSQHYNGAKGENFNIGFYHFMSEKTEPSQQAVDFWNTIKEKQFNVIPCLDIETNNMGRNQKQISDRCIEFLEKFKSLSGLDCMIYTGGFFGRDNLDNRVKQYPGWIAHYGVPSPMHTGFHVVGHQYTEYGHVNGINTKVDMNDFKEDIFLNKKEMGKVEYIVIYNDGADQRAAEYLADFLQCPTISNSRKFDFSCVENVYAVGNKKENYTSYLKVLLSGSDRYSTMQAVLDYIKKNS
ncbi:glycosyl hydrolase [Clostridium niameyense]|uniref:Glycosyl hydrolase n=1 Tax=Clostridium niameyense TaxID=1622073 RepID=A0A6M0R9N5_9CLOT|nr:GH25 family lysozyme [Clostridium niameyense]NEZ46487.1 glycosyl hydrolase [Clostridium niameyense]